MEVKPLTKLEIEELARSPTAPWLRYSNHVLSNAIENMAPRFTRWADCSLAERRERVRDAERAYLKESQQLLEEQLLRVREALGEDGELPAWLLCEVCERV